MMQENLLKEYGLYINGEWRHMSINFYVTSTTFCCFLIYLTIYFVF